MFHRLTACQHNEALSQWAAASCIHARHISICRGANIPETAAINAAEAGSPCVAMSTALCGQMVTCEDASNVCRPACVVQAEDEVAQVGQGGQVWAPGQPQLERH